MSEHLNNLVEKHGRQWRKRELKRGLMSVRARIKGPAEVKKRKRSEYSVFVANLTLVMLLPVLQSWCYRYRIIHKIIS